MSEAAPAVALKAISKRFGAVQALQDASFRARRGCIQALVGENGAGKTTLMKVLYGEHQPDSGSVELEGRPAVFRRASEAIAAGIGMVSQHYAIIPELTCLENLMLGAEPGQWIGLQSAQDRAAALAAEMGFAFDWRAPASRLSPGDAQKLEILKLLWRRADVMILDEPTAMLSPADADALYASLSRLAAEGRCIIVVTHRLPEVMDFCQYVTVLRAGRVAASMPVAETTQSGLAELIVGHGLSAPAITAPDLGEVLISCRSLGIRGDRGDDAVKAVELAVRAGEVVGIAGVDGSGQKELFECLLGVRKPSSGELSICGLPGEASTQQRLAAGVRSVPEDRLAQGVVGAWSLKLNAALGLQRHPRLSRGPMIDDRARSEHAAAFADAFGTRHGGLDAPLASLSGGNQQRFVAGRALGLDPKVILAFQPTRGLDIDGAAQVYSAIRARCREAGAAALVVSFDLDELLAQCDRIVVMCAGRLTEPPADKAGDRAAIGRLMTGGEA